MTNKILLNNLVKEIELDKDFDFLLNYNFTNLGIFTANDRGAIKSSWTIPMFINAFCDKAGIMTDAVYKHLLISKVLAPAHHEYVLECKNYIKYTLYVAAFIDMFIKAWVSNKKEISGYIATDTSNNKLEISSQPNTIDLINATIAFYATKVDKDNDELPDNLVIKVQLPKTVRALKGVATLADIKNKEIYLTVDDATAYNKPGWTTETLSDDFKLDSIHNMLVAISNALFLWDSEPYVTLD